MPARARRLTCAGLAAAAVTLAGCGSSSRSNPTPTPSGTHTTPVSPTPSATPVLVGTTRTVLSPLGLRIHSAPALGSSNVVGDAAEGATFSVLQYQSGGGGWFRVQGRSVTGWIVADPTLTAQGTFNAYQSADGDALLYPQDWAFQQESYGAIFLPQQGKQNIVLETGATLASFGPPGLAGYTQAMSGSVVVCGYTGTLNQYVKNPSYTGATPTPLPVARLPLYAEIRLKFDTSHAMLIGFDYENSSQLDVYADLYNSITFPFPRCELTSTPAP